MTPQCSAKISSAFTEVSRDLLWQKIIDDDKRLVQRKHCPQLSINFYDYDNNFLLELFCITWEEGMVPIKGKPGLNLNLVP